MQPHQPPSTPMVSSTSSSDPLYRLQPANTDGRPSQDSQSDDEQWSDPIGPSHGMSIWPRDFQRIPGPSYQSSVRRGNGATTHGDIPDILRDILHPKTSNFPLTFGTQPQQIQRGTTSQPLGTFEYPISPFPTTNISLHGSQQNASLSQDSPGPHPQSEARVVWDLLGAICANTFFGPPPEVATMSLRREVIDKSSSRITNLPQSAVRGITLERPQPANGETVVRVLGDTSITLSFDMKSFSRGSATYDGLKIPSTPSVRQRRSGAGKKLLHLRVRVLGATTKTPYRTLCHECKDRNGDRDAFPDFHAESNILVPQKNGKVLVAFTLACYSKHRKPHDSDYCLEVVLNGVAEQYLPTEYELPYSFTIMPKSPSRTRSPAMDVGGVGGVVPPPPPHNLSPEFCPPRPDNISSANPSPQVIRDRPGSPVGENRPASPARAPMPSRRWRPAVNAVREEPACGLNIVVMDANPRRGPMAGGMEIWIWIQGSDFPTDPIPLYARFGDKFTRVVIITPDLLACTLPRASVPGAVPITLTHDPNLSAPVLGTSFCKFEYITELNEISPTACLIQEDCTPEVEAAPDIILFPRR